MFTCKEIDEFKYLEKKGLLKPQHDVEGFFPSFSRDEIIDTIGLIYLINSKNSLLAKLSVKFLDLKNTLYNHLIEKADLTNIKKMPYFKKISKKDKLQEGHCFRNSFIIGLRLLESNKNSKLLSGFASTPQIDEQKQSQTILHSVIECDGYVIDYNYGIAMKKEYYIKLFKFDVFDEVYSCDMAQQIKTLKMYDTKNEAEVNSMHMACANQDWFKESEKRVAGKVG